MAAEKTMSVMVRMTPEVYAALKARAEEAERTIVQEVRLAIRRHLAAAPPGSGET